MATEKRHKRDDVWVRQLTLADPEEPGLAGPTIKGSSDGTSVVITNRAGTATTLNATELGFTDGVTAGTVLASKAAVVDSNKDIGDFRNVDVVNLDAGASGTAGTLDVFPTTAAKGKIQIAAADSAGDTTTTLTNRTQAGVRTYTIPDAGASADIQTLRGTVSGVGAATSKDSLLLKKTGIADNTATDVITVTVPNANHAAAIRLTLLSSNGSTDAFESSRVAMGLIVVARTTGANAVAVVAALALAQIATVAAGATHTLAYGVSAISGAVGATNTFTIQVTIDDSGNLGSNQVVVLAELLNAEATGVTMAAA